MNITAGTPVERGKYLEELNPKEYMLKLLKEGFSGYVCVTIHGKLGLEEGNIIMHNGNIVSSDYQYFYFDHEYKAKEALERSLNAFLAPIGVVDVYSLSANQVQLVMTLNEEHNLQVPVSPDLLNIPAAFSYSYEEQLRSTVPEEEDLSKEEILKRLGITRYTGSKTTRAELQKMSKQDLWEEGE
jgi:hypothetical protein